MVAAKEKNTRTRAVRQPAVPKLRGLVARRFRRAGDVEATLALVAESEGLQRTRELAGSYSEAAVTCLQHMRGSGHKQELLNMAETLASRVK